MGTGSSKSKNAKGKNQVVTANVIIPGKSQPVKVTGQLALADDNGNPKATTPNLSSRDGPAQVKQVAPNKYSLQMGERNVGTFDVPDGDFASYLASASELTITNIKEAGEESTSNDEEAPPIQIQLMQNSKGGGNYSDDEDWEEVIEELDDQSASASTSSDTTGGDESNTSERKNKLKNELRKKQAFLSQEEYEQMIANHKQEVELMNLLREKEKERQKYSLVSKVAQRKKKRIARKAEMIEREALRQGQGAADNERLQELQQEMEQTESQFQEEMSSKRKLMMTDAESEVIMATHKRKMAELQEEMKAEEERRKLSLDSKLAKRKEIRRKRKAEKEEQKRLREQQQKHESTERANVADNSTPSELKLKIEDKEAKFQQEVEAKKKELSEEEYQRLLAQHRQEMERLTRALEKSADRQKLSFEDKLAARRFKKKGALPVTPEEIRQLELELEQRQARFEAELREKRGQLSEEEYKKLIESHKRELTALREKLDVQRERQRQTLLEKLAARRAKKAKEEEPLTADEIQKLQLALNQMNLDFRMELNEARQDGKTEEECQALIDEHKAGMEELQQQLQKEKERMQAVLLDKLEARKNKKQEADANPLSQEEIKQLQLVVDLKEVTFQQELRAKKGKISEKELQALVSQHKKKQGELQRLLNDEKARTEETLKNKMATRVRYKMPVIAAAIAKKTDEAGETNEQMDIEQINEKAEELEHHKAEFEKEEREMRPLLSDEEFKLLLESHRRELNELEQKLELQRKRQHQTLLDKLAARRMRRGKKEEPNLLSSDEIKELQIALNQKAVNFRQEIADARKNKSAEEVKRIMDAHQKEMEIAQQQLDREKERMQASLMAKLEARKNKRNTSQTTEEEPTMSAEDIKQLQLLINKKDSAFKEELKAKKGKISDKEYQKIIDRHNQEMVDLQNLLDREKLRMEQKLKDKLAARRKRSDSARNKENEVDAEVKALEREIEIKMASLAQDAKQLRPLLSNEEYDQLLKQHKMELQDLKNRLDDAIRRQKQNFEDKLAARRAQRRLKNEEEERKRLASLLDDDNLTEEEIQELEDDIIHYNTVMTNKIHSQEGKISKHQFDQLISEHLSRMDAFKAKLERQRLRMGMGLSEKLAARRMREGTFDEGSDGDSSEDSTEEDGRQSAEQQDELGDFVDIQAISATTTLWTTPTQSSVLAVVPLKEEFPIRRKKQLYTDPSIFKHVDAHAIRLAQTASLVTQPSFSALVNELVRIATTELEKVRLIFRWITAQNCVEMDLADAVDDTPLGVLKGLYFTKITFSTLFMRMCRFVGLRCVEICGYAKLKGYQPGQQVALKNFSYSHTWNAVRIDGYWHFVDCNWGVSHIPGSVTFDPFRFEYDEHYFLADPDVIIKTHFPNDASWQLLLQPITIEQFNDAVPLKPDFSKFGFELQSHQSAIIDAPNGDLDIRLCCPPGFILYCKMSTVEGGREVSLHGVHFHQYVFIHQFAEDVMACYIRIPEPGHYYATFYAKQQFVDEELNLETQTEICKYYVRSYAPSSDQQPLPISPADHWGPVGVANAGLTPITHQGGVIMCQDGGDIDVRFKKTKQDLTFIHDMTGDGLHEKQLAPYSIQREVGDELVFTLCLPQPGRYGLHISAQYPGFQYPIYLCSYLIVMTVVRPVVQPIPPPPAGEEYGPSLGMQNLGLSPITHPDPFIRTQESQLQIIFSLSMKVILNQNLIYNPPVCTDLSRTVRQQVDSRSVTYFLTLNQPGYYHFRLAGKDADVPQIPNVLLYNYVIRKDQA